MPLLPPTRAKNRSKLADWVEILALITPRRFVTSSQVERLIEAESDGEDHGTEIDPITGEAIEKEILSSQTMGQIDALHEELQYRSKLCGLSYPFVIEYEEQSAPFAGTFRLSSRFADINGCKQHIFYVLCLLETGIRDKIIAAVNVNTTHHRLGLLFQVASCLALGCYLRGDTIWFGFPRINHTAFLPALKNAFQRYGSHRILDTIPPGFPPDLLDGGIDIIAWIDFGDGRGGRTIVFGQAASGYDWTSKTLLGFMAKFANWFEPPAPAHVKPAILIPFPIHHHLEERQDRVWEDEANGTILYHSSDFGVIFDRFRVATFAGKAFDLPSETKERIDGFDQSESVTTWVSELLAELRDSEAA